MEKTRKTVNISHAVHDIRSILYLLLISRESFISRQPKYSNGLTDIFIGTDLQGLLAVGKKKTKNLTNHRVALYHVKCIFVISLALPLLEPHLEKSGVCRLGANDNIKAEAPYESLNSAKNAVKFIYWMLLSFGVLDSRFNRIVT